jgi:fructokinase
MRIGVDLGGTKIEAIALAKGGHELDRHRVPAPQGDYDRTIRAIVELVAAIEAATNEQGSVGVGIPGAISPATGLVKNANSTWLIGQPLKEHLSRALGRPVRLANDANCFALSEATDGAGAGKAVVFGVILGTGTGGGIVAHGRILEGANLIGGEWGHNPLPAMNEQERPGAPCYCGRTGCIETFLSGPGLERDYRRSTSEGLDPIEIVARAGAGDARANATLTRYEDRLARALGSIINVLDPNVIVLGGGLSNITRLYDAVPARWSSYVFSDRVDTHLARAKHGDASGVRGAAWLWPE